MASPDQDLNAAIAVTRFGLGAKPGEIAAARRDPQGFLRDQIRRTGAETFQTSGQEDTAERVGEMRAYREQSQALRRARRENQDVTAQTAALKEQRRANARDTSSDFLERARLGSVTDAGFRERWALFWCNHFTVSATKSTAATVVGPFENEAIRPQVFGRFADLLQSVETHPAMLFYLDQFQSVGPNSEQSARRAQRLARNPAADDGKAPGLNENLAREILELHTVGVDGGYTQADVTEFARALTGVSIGGYRGDGGEMGKTVFREAAHEPGVRRVMNVSYRQSDGRGQTEAILADLAMKPATARFISYKIARHFVADAPPPALTARLQAAWLDSRGDLSRVAEALISAPEAWAPTQAKFKTPYDFIVSSYRAAGAQPATINKIAPILSSLGMKPFSARSPEGWDDETGAWAAPDAIIKRMQFAQAFSQQAIGGLEPSKIAVEALGARLTPPVAKAISRAESRPEGFSLLLMSPEFQRR